jgi:hypothetical protein
MTSGNDSPYISVPGSVLYSVEKGTIVSLYESASYL